MKRDHRSKQIIKNEEGSTGVLFALMAVPLLAMVGTAVDMARVIKTRDGVQTAMDSAMLAAGKVTAANQPTLAAAYFKANLQQTPDAKATFVVGADGNMTGSAKAIVRTPFSALMGKPSVTVSLSAKTRPQTTTLVDTMRVPCMHVMDQSGSRTLWLDSDSSVDASSCDVRVRSNASDGVYEISSAKVKFGTIRVKGASNINSGYSATGFSIVNDPFKVKEGEAIVADPYSTYVNNIRSQITVGTCKSINKSYSGPVTPGTYCGATEFKNVTFAAGLYIIASQGSTAGTLKFSGNIDGSAGVSFYMSDSKAQFLQYTPNDGSILAAPTSGLTKGLLFFESSNRGGLYTVTVASCQAHSWTGLVYMPGTNFLFDSLSSWPKMNVAVSANQIKMRSMSNIKIEAYSWVPYGYTSPVMWPGDPKAVTSEAAVIQ